MNKTVELLPCPFCGNDELTAEPETTYVMCHGCDADGPMTKPGEALKAWNTRAAPAEDVRAVVEEPVGLRAFANDMISAAYEGGSFDGGDIQDIAVKHGLLRIEQRVEACGEHCACSEYGFPAECYRRTDILKAPQ